MKLLWALLRWLLSHLVLFLAIAALVVISTILSGWWKERKQQEFQLQNLQYRLTVLSQKITKMRRDLSVEKRFLDLHENEPSRWTSPLKWYQWRKEMDLIGVLLDKKNAELMKLRRQKEQLAGEIEKASQSLYQTQQKILSVTRKSIGGILFLSALVFLGPLCWKAFWYFVVAGIARSAPKIQLEKPLVDEENIHVKQGNKNCAVSLQPGESLFARMSWIHQYAPTARKKTRFLWDWKSPFIGYAAGLAELTEVSVGEHEPETEVVVSSGQNPDTYLCEVQLLNHPGMVVYPSQVIAISGNVRLKTRWCLTNPHAWIAGRLRHIIFCGTGRIYVQGSGGIDPVPIIDQPVRISEWIVAAFETVLSFSTVRTETFWPYYRGIVPLFDYEFQGRGIILRQTAPLSKQKEITTIRFLDGLLNGIGKLLGL